MKNDCCKTLTDVQESLRAAVNDLGSDDICLRIHALIYLELTVKKLIIVFNSTYQGAIAEEFNAIRKTVEDAYNERSIF